MSRSFAKCATFFAFWSRSFANDNGEWCNIIRVLPLTGRSPLTAAITTITLCVTMGCNSRARDARMPVTLEVDNSTGPVVHLRLSMSPTDIAQGGAVVRTLEPDLVIGSGDAGFGHLADVTSYPDGRIAVVDRMESRISIYSRNGRELEHFGREGDGPGEFRSPFAITRFGDNLVISDFSPNKLLTVFSGSHLVSTIQQPLKGDWFRQPFRGPMQSLTEPYQSGPEDWTRRLFSFDDSTFVVLVREDEAILDSLDVDPESWRPTIRAIRISMHGEVLDTLFQLPGPHLALNNLPIRSRETGKQIQRSRSFSYQEAVFSARPIGSAGSGWYAFTDGERAFVEIRDRKNDSIATIEWPPAHRAVTEDDRIADVGWGREIDFLTHNSPYEHWWRKLSKSAQRKDIKRTLWILPFAPVAPEVVAIYGAGRCLWLAGFNASDFADGTSRTLIGIDVVNRTLAGVVRLSGTRVRLRSVDTHAIYATTWGDDGEDILLRYPLDTTACQDLTYHN